MRRPQPTRCCYRSARARATRAGVAYVDGPTSGQAGSRGLRARPSPRSRYRHKWCLLRRGRLLAERGRRVPKRAGASRDTQDEGACTDRTVLPSLRRDWAQWSCSMWFGAGARGIPSLARSQARRHRARHSTRHDLPAAFGSLAHPVRPCRHGDGAGDCCSTGNGNVGCAERRTVRACHGRLRPRGIAASGGAQRADPADRPPHRAVDAASRGRRQRRGRTAGGAVGGKCNSRAQRNNPLEGRMALAGPDAEAVPPAPADHVNRSAPPTRAMPKAQIPEPAPEADAPAPARSTASSAPGISRHSSATASESRFA